MCRDSASSLQSLSHWFNERFLPVPAPKRMRRIDIVAARHARLGDRPLVL